MPLSKTKSLFKKIDFLSKLSEESAIKLSEQIETFKFMPGEIVSGKDYKNDCFFIIEKGAIKFEEEKELLAILDAGKSFGEMALLGTEERNLTATALLETSLLSIHRDSFFEVLSHTPLELNQTIGILIARLRKQNISTLAQIKLREKELLKENDKKTKEIENIREEMELIQRKMKTAMAKISTSDDKKLYFPLSKSFINAAKALDYNQFSQISEEITNFKNGQKSELKHHRLSEVLDENLRNAYLSFQTQIKSAQVIIQREYMQSKEEVTINRQEFGGLLQNILDFIFDNLQRKFERSAFDYMPKLTVTIDNNSLGTLIRFKFNGIKISTKNFETSDSNSINSVIKNNSDHSFDLFTCGFIIRYLYYGKLLYLGEESLNTIEWHLGDGWGRN